MASRGAFGFRSAKQPEREEQKERPSGSLMRKASITSSASSSKLPAQSTSFFSRNKQSRTRADPPAPKVPTTSSIPIADGQVSINIGSSRSEPGVPLRAEPLRTPAMGVSSTNTTVQTKSGKPRNVLRRKAPLIDQRSGYERTESSASSYELPHQGQARETRSSPGVYTDSNPRSLLGTITMPPTQNIPLAYAPSSIGSGSEFATSSSRMATFNSRKTPPPSASTPSIPPPTPTLGHDSGSSTRRSESPGAFSRASTPTSMSSQSPGVPTPAKVPVRKRQLSPTKSRPPVSRSKYADRLLQNEDNNLLSQSRGLTAVRESATSSSSSSTVKPESRAGSHSKQGGQDRSSPRSSTPPSRANSKTTGTSQRGDFLQRQGSLTTVSEPQPRIAARSADPLPEHQTRDISVAKSSRSRIPPPRPSREGVPGLSSSIISAPGTSLRHLPQLQTATTRRGASSERERSGVDAGTGMARPIGTSFGRSPSSASSTTPLSRLPSPNPSAGRPSPSISSETFRSREPSSTSTGTGGPRALKDPSPSGSASTTSSRRFGFFSKRTRSPLETTVTDKADKSVKKGPAAGTGHEGYGKYARRGRSGSVTTNASRGRSTSSTSIRRTPSSRKSSLTSREEPELDEFYLDRLAPRTISGGGQAAECSVTEPDVYLPQSSQSSLSTFSGGQSSTSGGPPMYHRDARLEWSGDQTPMHNLRHDYRRLPHREETSTDSMIVQTGHMSGGIPNLATRRSLHRSQLLSGADPVKIPARIKTEDIAPSPAMDSQDTYQSSAPQTGNTVPSTDDISEGHEGNWLKSRSRGKPTKSPKKWNFFHRTQPSPRRAPVPAAPVSDEDAGNVQELQATVSRLPESRPVPFYALIDTSEQEGLDRFVRVQNSSKLQQGSTSPERRASPEIPRRELSMLLPSPPKLMAEFPTLAPASASHPRNAQDATVQPAAQREADLPKTRKPRLQQVGRIPRVVSKRDRPHRPPPQSFSRPRPYTPRTAEEEAASSALVTLGPSAEGFRAAEQQPLEAQNEVHFSDPWASPDSTKSPSASTGLQSQADRSEAKDEFLSFPPRIGSEVSRVSGSSSSGTLAFATAVIPAPEAALEEDEVWNEYNEFLDTVESPASLSRQNTNSPEKRSRKRQWTPAPLQVRKESSTTASSDSAGKKQEQSFTYPPATAPTRDLPSPPKRSNLLDLPPTPGTGSRTISDLLAGYGDRNRNSDRSMRPISSRYSTSSIESEADELASREYSYGVRTHPSPAMTAAQRLSQIYLRRDALLASRWLSFDRVLFSPAHFEIRSNSKDRVLVLDGLGNDEWSYYCAENYPDAQVYNLSPVQRKGEPAAISHIAGALKSPENHRHIHHASLDRPFPFPQDFFTAAVFRFPAAASEAAYLNAISEFKRVLRPGGFLEMSMLDIDMVNMGNLTRRALRELKQRKTNIQPEISLKPLSDNIQKMVGRKGYENLNRCMLDVPVAGQINNSRTESLDEASKLSPKPAAERHEGTIAKNLAKVGRWWFTSCYETSPFPVHEPSKSIWTDESLLAECEARETGFKLLLCYAQKPATRRRTRSF